MAGPRRPSFYSDDVGLVHRFWVVLLANAHLFCKSVYTTWLYWRLIINRKGVLFPVIVDCDDVTSYRGARNRPVDFGTIFERRASLACQCGGNV